MREVDCAIVGGGPAGLSAAVNLARMRRSVLVIDDRDGRSLWGQTNRNYLGFPNGIPAAEIRLAARKQAAGYGAKFLSGQVVEAVRAADGVFRLRIQPRPEDPNREIAGRLINVKRDQEQGLSLGEERPVGPVDVQARTVVLASGVRDPFPRFLGWGECVGRSLFWCIGCDGYEASGKLVAVVGDDEESAETALDLLEFTDRVTLVAGRIGFNLSEKRLGELRDNGIKTHPYGVASYKNTRGQIEALVLDNDQRTRIPVQMVFVYRRPIPRNEIALALGAKVNDLGHVVVDSEAHTSVTGLYAAGDLTNLHDHQISAAVHEGAQAAAAANYYLYRPVQRSPGSIAR
jgi:thioredoxin reductase (NADPH)